MEFGTIRTLEEFRAALRLAGFAMGGSNAEGIFSLSPFLDPSLHAHSGDPETDPWIWRIRALEDRTLAYGKVFFGKSGWISRDWYPVFLAARRRGRTLDEMYGEGLIGRLDRDLYRVVAQAGVMPLHRIKAAAGCDKPSRIDAALTRLQAGLFLTICGETRKVSRTGEPYGWPVSLFCTPEAFFPGDVWEESLRIAPEEACFRIREHIARLNPQADEQAVRRFIGV